jgi:hypothetical protein
VSEPTTQTGTIVDVELVTLGSELDDSSNLTSGSTGITVVDASDFDAEDGGSCAIDGSVYTYVVVDPDAGTLTITPGLVATATSGDRVDVWDLVLETAETECRAKVELPGDIDNADAVDALVGSAVLPLLSQQLGIRDPGTGEIARLQLVGGEWVVVDLGGGNVRTDASLLVPPLLLYNGTPAFEQLLMTAATSAGGDSYGNGWIGPGIQLIPNASVSGAEITIGAGTAGAYYAAYATFSIASVPNNTLTGLAAANITMIEERSDYGFSNWSAGIFTVPVSGFWDISAWTPGVTSAARTTIRVMYAVSPNPPATELSGGDDTSGGVGRASFATTQWLLAGDVIQIFVFQNSGSAAAMSGNFSVCRRL